MAKLPGIIPISDLRQDASAVLNRVKSSATPLVITQRGRASAVLLSVEAYERGQSELEILRLLAAGEQDITAGKGHALEDVMKEADEVLAEE